MRGAQNPARRWIPVFALFELHNAEEIVRDLPAWGRAHMPGLTGLTLGRPGFAAVIAVLSAVLFAIAWAFRDRARATRRLQMLFLAVMMAVFVWHIAISIHTRSLQPGVVTAAVFLPLYALMLYRLRRTPA